VSFVQYLESWWQTAFTKHGFPEARVRGGDDMGNEVKALREVRYWIFRNKVSLMRGGCKTETGEVTGGGKVETGSRDGSPAHGLPARKKIMSEVQKDDKKTALLDRGGVEERSSRNGTSGAVQLGAMGG